MLKTNRPRTCDQDVSELRGGRWSEGASPRRGMDIRAGNHPSRRRAFRAARISHPAPDDAACTSSSCGPSRDAGCSQRRQFLWSAGNPGWSKRSRLTSPVAIDHALLLHHRPLPRPGKSQLIPDVVGQYGIGPDAPSLDHARFFPRVSACGSPGSSPAKPSVNAASTVG